ncbi:uncharacterized protein DS421_15g489580 [Arachis hypogaea]|nr:uncharacterized protein DS421_15g489580 [Arachis hypogaea]
MIELQLESQNHGRYKTSSKPSKVSNPSVRALTPTKRSVTISNTCQCFTLIYIYR